MEAWSPASIGPDKQPTVDDLEMLGCWFAQQMAGISRINLDRVMAKMEERVAAEVEGGAEVCSSIVRQAALDEWDRMALENPGMVGGTH